MLRTRRDWTYLGVTLGLIAMFWNVLASIQSGPDGHGDYHSGLGILYPILGAFIGFVLGELWVNRHRNS